jgi:aspartyl-tRNA(Asn)/glutamyl-tRNA(Gln) amidotransferase subunit B
MEQDTAKSLAHPTAGTLLDFNRVSHPLIEIITLPQIHHPATAAACVRKIQAILKSVGAVVAGMELGGLRADVNVSVRRSEHASQQASSPMFAYYGVTGLGQRTEIKNLSSIKAVEDAIVAERDRQVRVLEDGGTVLGETRGWSLGSTETVSLRGKEGEVDYRYMPDPDLSPLVISDKLVKRLRETLPSLPDTMLEMLVSEEYGLSETDAKTLIVIDDGERLDFYLDVVQQARAALDDTDRRSIGRVAGNFVLHELGTLLTKSSTDFSSNVVPAQRMAEVLQLVLVKKITNDAAKSLILAVFEGSTGSVAEIAEREGWLTVQLDDSVYSEAAAELVKSQAKVATAIKERGEKGKINFLVGQLLKQMKQAGHGGLQPDKVRIAVYQELGINENPST